MLFSVHNFNFRSLIMPILFLALVHSFGSSTILFSSAMKAYSPCDLPSSWCLIGSPALSVPSRGHQVISHKNHIIKFSIIANGGCCHFDTHLEYFGHKSIVLKKNKFLYEQYSHKKMSCTPTKFIIQFFCSIFKSRFI